VPIINRLGSRFYPGSCIGKVPGFLFADRRLMPSRIGVKSTWFLDMTPIDMDSHYEITAGLRRYLLIRVIVRLG
jgi:kynureninase